MGKKGAMTRRRLLKGVVGVIGATTLLCAGVGVWATRRPTIAWIEAHCGKEGEMMNRMLVTYATRAGSTAEVAEAIGKALCSQGMAVDVLPAKEVTGVGDYRAVVVGSAVYMGRWLGDASRLIEAHQATLQQVPVAYFSVCLTAKDDTEQARATMAAYTAPQRALAAPMAEVFFAGSLNKNRQPFLYRLIAKAMQAPEEDLRDFGAIRAWAEGLPTQLGFTS